MRYRGADVGNFFLAEKADGEKFTGDDEEVLVLFASLAAAAIANARTHRDERQVRADLAALVETSPVGVVVFDAKSGRLASLNREARRIVESLRPPGHPPEQFLELITFRRADGREVSLGELPLTQLLGTGETVRAEEVVLSVPDGRSVRTLINATPIRAEGGAVRSLVVTMQDLAPLDEIERLRTEFLGLVSHELREPLAAIKGSATTLLEEASQLDPARDARVPPYDRRAGQPHARPDRRPAGHRAHRIGHALGRARAHGGSDLGGAGAQHVPERRRGPRRPRGRAGRPAAGDRRPAAHRPGAQRPLRQRRAARSRVVPHPGRGGARGGARLGLGRGGGAPERLPYLFRRHAGTAGGATAGPRPRARDLQGACRGARRAHPGREPRPPAAAPRSRSRCPRPAVPRPRRRPRDRDAVPRIFVVDDDPKMLRFVRGALSAAGYTPLVTGGPEDLAHIIRTEKPQLVLLDLVLPGQRRHRTAGTGPGAVRPARHLHSAYRRDDTVAQALEAGAADYIAKPLLADRAGGAGAGGAFVIDQIAIDYAQCRVTVGGEAVDLPATEYELLRVLSLDAGRVVTFDTLLRRVWAKRENADANLVRIFRPQPPPQARRQRGQPHLHLQPARRRLLHGEAGGPLRARRRCRRAS